jgi:hypothetical protein
MPSSMKNFRSLNSNGESQIESIFCKPLPRLKPNWALPHPRPNSVLSPWTFFSRCAPIVPCFASLFRCVAATSDVRTSRRLPKPSTSGSCLAWFREADQLEVAESSRIASGSLTLRKTGLQRVVVNIAQTTLAQSATLVLRLRLN